MIVDAVEDHPAALVALPEPVAALAPFFGKLSTFMTMAGVVYIVWIAGAAILMIMGIAGSAAAPEGIPN